MKRFHLAIATHDIEATVRDYSDRLGAQPCVVVPNEYALWRTETLNLSIRQDRSCKSGELRHLGWEDPAATEFTTTVDVNGLTWERFNSRLQVEEIQDIWPDAQVS
jgi:extradiol dioxygenase family protein